MDSDQDNLRSRRLGFPIRTSPDHNLFAAPRGLSQLTTSFFAYLHLGIHTHALSSLTIRLILDTSLWRSFNLQLPVNILLSKNSIAFSYQLSAFNPESASG